MNLFFNSNRLSIKGITLFFTILLYSFSLTIETLAYGRTPMLVDERLREQEVNLKNKSNNAIAIKQIKVLGSTVFSQKKLNATTEKFLGKTAIMPNLVAIRSSITNLYVSAGYATSGAFVPQQDVSDGIVEIQVVEGRLEDIEITGLTRLKESYVRSRIERFVSSPLNVNKLQQGLQLFLFDPLIESFSSELAVGSSQGLSRLEISLKEAPSFSVGIGYDNTQSPAVGTDNRIFKLGENNLFGFGDRFNFSYANTDGSDSFDFAYSIPLNSSNATLAFSYGNSSNEIVEEPFTPLDLQTQLRFYEITFRQPILLSPTENINLGLTASRQESQSSLLGIDFPLNRGADAQGRTRISAIRFFQEYIDRDFQDVFYVRSLFSLGVGAFEANTTGEPDSQFFNWRLQSQYVRTLAPDTFFLVRGQLQISGDDLLSDEQFRVGGFETVRGYRQNLLLGNNGVFASAEMRVPILRIQEWETVLQVAPFFDVGKVWGSDNLDFSTLASLGLGLRLTAKDNLSAGFYWAVPLMETESQGKSLQEDGINFFVETQISF